MFRIIKSDKSMWGEEEEEKEREEGSLRKTCDVKMGHFNGTRGQKSKKKKK